MRNPQETIQFYSFSSPYRRYTLERRQLAAFMYWLGRPPLGYISHHGLPFATLEVLKRNARIQLFRRLALLMGDKLSSPVYFKGEEEPVPDLNRSYYSMPPPFFTVPAHGKGLFDYIEEQTLREKRKEDLASRRYPIWNASQNEGADVDEETWNKLFGQLFQRPKEPLLVKTTSRSEPRSFTKEEWEAFIERIKRRQSYEDLLERVEFEPKRLPAGHPLDYELTLPYEFKAAYRPVPYEETVDRGLWQNVNMERDEFLQTYGTEEPGPALVVCNSPTFYMRPLPEEQPSFFERLINRLRALFSKADGPKA